MISLDKDHAIFRAAANAAFAFQHAAKIIQIRILSDKTDNAGHEFVTTHTIQVDPQILLLRRQSGWLPFGAEVLVGTVHEATKAAEGALLHECKGSPQRRKARKDPHELCALGVLAVSSHLHHVINGLVISNPNRRASSSLKGPCIFR